MKLLEVKSLKNKGQESSTRKSARVPALINQQLTGVTPRLLARRALRHNDLRRK